MRWVRAVEAHADATSVEHPAAIIPRQKHLRRAAGLRKMMQYQNEHYTILSEVVARVSGQAYPVWLKQNVFGPLGMEQTTDDERDADGLRASGRVIDGFVRRWTPMTAGSFVEGGSEPDAEVEFGAPETVGSFLQTDGMRMQGCAGMATTIQDAVSRAVFFLPSQLAGNWGLRLAKLAARSQRHIS